MVREEKRRSSPGRRNALGVFLPNIPMSSLQGATYAMSIQWITGRGEVPIQPPKPGQGPLTSQEIWSHGVAIR
jgi:hypothetical protein